MKSIRTLLTAGMAVLVVLALSAAPASAKRPSSAPYTYFATIDCGAGQVQIGSYDDLWAPLVDLATGFEYEPVAWDVVAGGHVIHELKYGHAKRRAVVCDYDDGFATGTVTVKRVPRNRADRGHSNHRDDDRDGTAQGDDGD
jgi:hypothetical protein